MSRAKPVRRTRSAPRLPSPPIESLAVPAGDSESRAPAELPSGVRRTASTAGFRLAPTRRAGALLGGRYCIEGFLARGGTADVFLARDFLDDGLVVLKQIRPEIASHPELRERFVKEGLATRRICHPGVVRVLSVEEPPDEPPFITLEALRGESLGDYLRREAPLPVERGILLARQAARALAAVHAVGVVHRDVKPDNLFLVGPAGEPESLKLLDFGMARFADEAHSEDSTSVLGTAQYMAPEQILVEPVDARADIYGLGVVMFRMFTGHLPFEGKDAKELLLHQLFSPVPPPSWLVEDMDPVLEEIILQATRKHVAHRHQTMEDLACALDSLAGLCPAPPLLAPLRQPDVYRPVTARGQRVARHLATEYGPYAPASASTAPASTRSA